MGTALEIIILIIACILFFRNALRTIPEPRETDALYAAGFRSVYLALFVVGLVIIIPHNYDMANPAGFKLMAMAFNCAVVFILLNAGLIQFVLAGSLYKKGVGSLSFCSVIGFYLCSYALLYSFNIGWDRSAPELHKQTIIDKEYIPPHLGKGSSGPAWSLIVRDWHDADAVYKVQVSQQTYDNIPTGGMAAVYTKSGALGYEYVTGASPVSK